MKIFAPILIAIFCLSLVKGSSFPGIVISDKDGQTLESLAKIWTNNPLKRWDPKGVLSGCYWEGIVCNLNGSLTSIQFSVNSTQNWPIPDLLGNFAELETLKIAAGWAKPLTLPATLNKLTKLKELEIEDTISPPSTNVTAVLPDLSKLSSLTLLKLHSLKTSLEFPQWIYNLKSLTTLDLSENVNVTGKIDYNQLSTLPLRSVSIVPAYVNCPGPNDSQYLQKIYEGLISSIGEKCPALTLPPEILFLQQMYSNFSSCLDKTPSNQEIESACNNGIDSVVCLNNRITNFKLVGNGKKCKGGSIPTSISNLGNLKNFTLEGVTIAGGFSSLTSIKLTNLELNRVKSDIKTLPQSFCSLSNIVQNLRISHTDFVSVPDCIFSDFSSLSLDNNNMNGYIPLQICNSTILNLNISFNNFEGYNLTLCDVNGKFVQNVLSMDLKNNKKLGGLFTTPSIYPSLTYLDISNDSFYGELQDIFPGSLEYFLAHGNNLTGTIGEAWASDFFVRFDVSNNHHLSGALPVHFGEVPGLLEFRIYGTNLTCPTNDTWRSKWNTVMIDCGFPPYIPPTSQVPPTRTMKPINTNPDDKTYELDDGWITWVVVGSIIELVFILLFVAIVVLTVLIRRNKIKINHRFTKSQGVWDSLKLEK